MALCGKGNVLERWNTSIGEVTQSVVGFHSTIPATDRVKQLICSAGISDLARVLGN